MTDRYENIRRALEEMDALRRALERILENEASDWKAAEEFGGYVLDDELREEARAALQSAPGQELARHLPCGCILCVCEDEKECQGCGAKICGSCWG